MAADHMQVLGNFGAKHRVEHNGTAYVFNWPGKAIVADMVRMCKEAARRSLLDSREYLTAEDYAQEAREYKHRLDTGYFAAPSGTGFTQFYQFQNGTIDGLVTLCQCLLLPNHPKITASEVTALVLEHMDEVVIILQELMPKEASEGMAAGDGPSPPKAPAGGS